MPRHQLSLRPCTVPPSCSLLKLSLLSLRPSLLQFVSIVSPLLNHGNPIFEPVRVFCLFLFCLHFSDRNKLQLQVPVCNLVVITTEILLLLFPCYRFLAVSEIFNHSDTCAGPSVCNAVCLLVLFKLCPVLTFPQQLMTKKIVSYLHIHVFSNVLHRRRRIRLMLLLLLRKK